MDDLNDYVLVAKVGKAHGIKGESRLYLQSELPEEFEYECELLLVSEGVRKNYTVQNVRPQGKFLVVKLNEIYSRNEAELLSGSIVYIHKSYLPESDDGDHYWYEYKGLTVFTDKGEDLGTVQEILETGAHGILIVTGKGREYMIPLVDDIVTETDLENGTITIAPPDGLLDMND